MKKKTFKVERFKYLDQPNFRIKFQVIPTIKGLVIQALSGGKPRGEIIDARGKRREPVLNKSSQI